MMSVSINQGFSLPLFFRYLSLYWLGDARKGIHSDKLGMKIFVAVAGMLILAQSRGVGQCKFL
jgi:hypothetical protein